METKQNFKKLSVFQYAIYAKLSQNFRFVKNPCEVSLKIKGEFGESGRHTALVGAQNSAKSSTSSSDDNGPVFLI